MAMSFHVAALSGDQVPLALPLIQATWPDVDLVSWQSFVEFYNDQTATKGSGVLALRDPAGCICGVLAYRLDRDLRAGATLAVHLFTAIGLVNSLTVARALLEVAHMRAIELGCVGVQIRLSNKQPGLASRLRTLGLSSEAGLFWRKIDPLQTRN
jgi:hypothetical protein